jgi:hypothetical protein
MTYKKTGHQSERKRSKLKNQILDFNLMQLLWMSDLFWLSAIFWLGNYEKFCYANLG